MEYLLFDVSKPVTFCHAGKSQMAEDWMHYERVSNDYILFMVLDGALHLAVDAHPYSLYPGDVFIMKAGAHHVGTQPAAVTFYWLHFHPNQIRFLNHEQALCLPAAPAEPPQILLPTHFKMQNLENFVISINQLIHHYSQEPQSLLNNYLATAVLIEMANQTGFLKRNVDANKNRRFEEIKSYIAANYREELQVADIAEKFDYNEKYLAKLFQLHLGTTVKGFIIETRLRAAEHLLLSTNEPISLIARNSGFHNEYYFMRLFKEKRGMSPTHYRNTYHLQVLTRYP